MLGLQAITKLERFNYIHSDITEYKNKQTVRDATTYENGPEYTGATPEMVLIMNLLVATNSDDTRLH